MQEHCNRCDNLCICQDWKSGDLTQMVNHLINYFRFTGFELKYHTLEPGETGRMLCCIGKCFMCGRRLCHGTELPSDQSMDSLLAHIYRWAYQLWDNEDEGTTDFRTAFRALFHMEDQPMVDEWLSRPENQHIGQMYCCDGLEG